MSEPKVGDVYKERNKLYPIELVTDNFVVSYVNEQGYCLEIGAIGNRVSCIDHHCMPLVSFVPADNWNTRPAEDALRAECDALRAQVAELTAEITRHEEIAKKAIDALTQLKASLYRERAAKREEIEEIEAELAQAREAAKTLLTAAEMHRAWEVNSSDDFNEMYPDEEGWAHGDVDENLIQAMDKVSAALAGKVEK